jgi:sulfide:quinone oxidoreductase
MAESKHQIVIVGGGAAGISTAASLLRRRANLDIAIIEPADTQYYQPGWTMVGSGIFDRTSTARPMASVMPAGVRWIRQAASEFAPEQNEVVLANSDRVGYDILVAAPGIKLDWASIEGLPETLGKNGVTSNYCFDTAPYTWELVQTLKSGRAIFTQPPMPIKCAGAPQKAMYLSCDHWLKQGNLKDIQVEFDLATAALFGVAAYVPALMEYVRKYGIALNFTTRLTKVDGPAKRAWFEVTKDGVKEMVEKSFDMIHVCPPQTAPDFVRKSSLANAAGWIEVSEQTLQHVRYKNVFGLGDVCSTSNAKTAAAVRKQAPTVATNVLRVIDGQTPNASYNGYGSCPLTVERGKIVLAEFGYGGKLLPTFPKWLIDGTRPTSLAWMLKKNILPFVYWKLMLRGHEWFAGPDVKAA